MTPDEQRAANREIAEAMGAGWYKWQGRRFLATSEYMAKRFDMNHADAPTECGDDESIPLFSDWDKGIPDIFADSDTGAGARERAEEWLERHGKRIVTSFKTSEWREKISVWWESQIELDSPMAELRYGEYNSDTSRIESRANAIAAAFRALKEGER